LEVGLLTLLRSVGVLASHDGQFAEHVDAKATVRELAMGKKGVFRQITRLSESYGLCQASMRAP